VAGRFLVIDLKRQSPLRTLLFPALALPVNLTRMPWSWIWPGLHDGFISALRAYSLPALEELGHAADPGMRIETLPPPKQFGLPSHIVVFSRSGSPDHD
jgi:hypothetical protein